ncbi:MAG: FkbM family methyltransferase [Alphaproteobacteria bacterium]|nr:FkbM family methyltransferase [Alphaproteobacteria bacterium]MBV9863126.1 FkbM family methyltransferase [Alphaproteobacteria bacterium]
MRLLDQKFEWLAAGLHGLDEKLTKMWLDLDFIRTRLSSYVGDGIALTYLVDHTMMFVNSNDIGNAHLLGGGRYEEENLAVLLSFVTPDTVFLDIGANLGFFSLQIGRRLTGTGKVYAFEPHPMLLSLLQRNLFVNGLAPVVTCYGLALSDENAPAELHYPFDHLGGGAFAPATPERGGNVVKCEARRLDDVLDADFRCDLVKIDVEGHELDVLNGMRRIVANSPRIKILFEKLSPQAGTEAAIEGYCDELGLTLYAVRPDSSLSVLAPGELSGWVGYGLAAAPGAIENGLQRTRFTIFPKQMLVPDRERGSVGEKLHRTGPRGQILFHGPYWFIARGTWRLKWLGDIRGTVLVWLLERFGQRVLSFELDRDRLEHVFTLPRDLVHFECAACSAGVEAEINVRGLELIREG